MNCSILVTLFPLPTLLHEIIRLLSPHPFCPLETRRARKVCGSRSPFPVPLSPRLSNQSRGRENLRELCLINKVHFLHVTSCFFIFSLHSRCPSLLLSTTWLTFIPCRWAFLFSLPHSFLSTPSHSAGKNIERRNHLTVWIQSRKKSGIEGLEMNLEEMDEWLLLERKGSRNLNRIPMKKRRKIPALSFLLLIHSHTSLLSLSLPSSVDRHYVEQIRVMY